MKKGTGIILRLVIVLVILTVFAGAVLFVWRGLRPNYYKITAQGIAYLDSADKEFKSGDTSKAWDDLNKAKECFNKVTKNDATRYKAFYGLGHAYLMEAENSLDSPDKAHDALLEAEKSLKTVVIQFGGRWHLPSVIDLCKIYDQYLVNPEYLRQVAEQGVTGQQEHPIGEDDPDYKKLVAMRVQLHYYLAKSTLRVAQDRVFGLIYGMIDVPNEQDKKLDYAQAALDLKEAEKEFLEVKKAADEKLPLPEDLTIAQIYGNMGEIELHLLDCYWRIYEPPGVEFTDPDPDKVKRRRDVYSDLGILTDVENKTFRKLSDIRKEIAEKTTNASVDNPVDDKTINYFDLARKAAEDAVKNAASDSDAEKAKAALENTLLNIGRNECLYGIVPPDWKQEDPRPGENFLDEILKSQSVAKTDTFYIQYADILQTIGKPQRAQDILGQGIAALNTPNLYMALGRFFASQGKFLEAKAQFETALAADKESEATHYYMADLLVIMSESGNKTYLKDAAAHVAWLVAKSPDSVNYLTLEGRLHMQTPSEYGQAEEVFNKMYEMSGRAHFQGAYMLGLLYKRQGNMRQAEEKLIEAKSVPLGSFTAAVYTSLAGIYVDSDPRRALDLCEEYIKSARNQRGLAEASVLLLKAQCQAALGQKDEAKKTYDELIGRGNMTARLNKGYMLLNGFTRSDDINMAEYEFNHIINSEASRPPLQKTLGAYYGLAQCRLREQGSGVQGALKVLEKDMAPIVAELKAGMANGAPDEQQDAKEKYKRYLIEEFDLCMKAVPPDPDKLHGIAAELQAVAPNDPETFQRQLSAASVTSFDPDKEESVVEKQIADASSDDAKQGIRRDYAQALLAADRMDKAEKWFQEVLKNDPKDFVANRGLALVYIGKAKYDDADNCIKALEQALPGDPQVIIVRCQLDAARTPDVAGKISVIKSAVEKHPDIPQLHFVLAQAYEEAAKAGGGQGDPADNLQLAIGEYQSVFERSGGGNVSLGVSLAIARLNLARMQLNMRNRSAANQNYQACLNIVDLLNQTFPDNSEYMKWRAECMSALAKDAKGIGTAISWYEKAKDGKLKELALAEGKGDAGMAKRLKSDLYSIYNNLVGLLTATGDTKLARTYTGEMGKYASEPRDRLAVLLVGARIPENEKKYGEAEKVYQDALKNQEITNDKDVHIELIRQFALYYSRRADNASSDEDKKKFTDLQMKAIDDGLALYADSPILAVAKVEVLWKSGEQAEALKLLQKTREEDEKKDRKDRNPNLYIALAMLLESMARTPEDWDAAEQCMQEGIDLVPGQPQVYMNLMNLYLRHLDVFKAKAENFVADLLQKSPDSSLFITFKAQLLAATGDMEGAIAQYRQATEKDPTNESAYIGWKDVILQKSPDAVKDAIAVLKKGLEKIPASVTIKDTIGLLSMNTAPDYAKELFQSVLDVNNKDSRALQGMAYLASMELANPEVPYSTALKEAESAIGENLYRSYPDDVVAQRLMGMLSAHRGDASSAADYFKGAYSTGKDAPSLSALSHLELDRRTVKMDYAGLKAWAMSLRKWRDDAALQVFVGRCSMKAGEDGADDTFKTAAALTNDAWAVPYVFMDVYYLDRAKTSSADAAFEECVKRLSKNAGETNAYAMAYVEAGHPERAIQLLERAAASADDAGRWQLDALRAYIYLTEMNDAAQAKEIARKVLDAAGDKGPAAALCVIGKILCDAGDLDGGIAQLDKAIAADVTDPRPRIAMAEARYAKYKAATESVTTARTYALTAIQDAVRMDPYGFTMVRPYLLLGDVYFDNGQKKEASDAYKRYIELGGNERLDEINKRIIP